jgi:hypothetical protein
MACIPVSGTHNTGKSAHLRSTRRSCELHQGKQIVFAVITAAAHVATKALSLSLNLFLNPKK